MFKRRSKHGGKDVLENAIAHLEGQMNQGELKCSMGDLVRLLQLRSEMGGSQPTPVTVRWVDECQTPASDE